MPNQHLHSYVVMFLFQISEIEVGFSTNHLFRFVLIQQYVRQSGYMKQSKPKFNIRKKDNLFVKRINIRKSIKSKRDKLFRAAAVVNMWDIKINGILLIF